MEKIKKYLMSVALLLTIFTVVGCGKVTSESIEEDINKGNYSDIAKDFTKLEDNEKTEVLEKLKLEGISIKEQFINDEIDKEKAIDSLEKIKKVDGMEKSIDSEIGIINKINDSKLAFTKGKEAEESKDKQAALEEYSKVIKEDTKNYNVAQSKIEKLKKEIEDSIEVKVKSSKILVSSDQYKALYPDKLSATMINKTKDKTIKNLVVGFLAWDKNGYPLKIKGQYSFGNEGFEFIGKADNINVLPGKTFGDNYGWDLDQDHNIHKVLACVKSVEYYDGTSWENPLYNTWIEEYKEKPLK